MPGLHSILSAVGAGASRACNSLLHPFTRIKHYDDGARLTFERLRTKSGSRYVEQRLRLGPNAVHAAITHSDGSLEDLGISYNLLTNIGRDMWSAWLGGAIVVQNNPATTVTATAVTGTGSTWTASNLGTGVIGLAGYRIVMPITAITTAPVYGNIVSNTTSVATIDQWWTAADVLGTQPASTNSFIIMPGGLSAIRYMALTTDASAPSAADTVLASEITTGTCGRALATYAHTPAGSTLTLQKIFSPSAPFTAIHKIGLFTGLPASPAGPMVFESLLNADATVIAGDTLTISDVITPVGT